ncbi:hypothetical protein FWP46_25935 [Vibrio alginolyticus]|nr:hypothetical protein [Vibrio alginolyticus]EJS2612235.1 hypothetical protein [Vibrio alginolyticus]
MVCSFDGLLHTTLLQMGFKDSLSDHFDEVNSGGINGVIDTSFSLFDATEKEKNKINIINLFITNSPYTE